MFHSFSAASVADVQAAIEHIFPLVYEFRKKRTPEVVINPEVVDDISKEMNEFEEMHHQSKKDKLRGVKRKYPFGLASNDPQEDHMILSDDDIDDDDDVDDVDDDV